MMRIRDLLKSFRTRRARQLSRTDSVSFEAFCNDSPPDKYPETKESSLTGDYKLSPAKLNVSNFFCYFNSPLNVFSKNLLLVHYRAESILVFHARKEILRNLPVPVCQLFC